MVSIGRLLYLAFLFGWHFLNKISLDWLLTSQLSRLLQNFKTLPSSPHVPRVRESGTCEIFFLWIPESGNILLMNLESWVLESGIQLKESRIPLMIRIQVLLTNTEIQYLESRIHSVESRYPRLSWFSLHGATLCSLRALLSVHF